MSCAIQAQDVCFSYNASMPQVVSGIDVAFESGTLTAILGPNGAGKTTLLHLFLGLYKPDSGRLFFSGIPADSIDPVLRRKMVGIVSQNNDVPFDMTVFEYVLLGRAPHKRLLQIPDEEDAAIADRAVKIVGMTHKKTAGIKQLSSGERQLADVARLLAQNPGILLLDEPCSHLDLINTRRVLELMSAVSREGKTVVFTTHDPNAASAVADTILLVRGGRCLAQGVSGEIMTPDLLSRTYGDRVEVVTTPRGPMVTVM